MIEEWLKSIGKESEEDVYVEGLFEIFLHQLTITNAAFAIVPWLMHACAQPETKCRFGYVTDIGVVEANRIEHGLYYNREGTEEYPLWLMPSYFSAIRKARDLAMELIALDPAAAQLCGLSAIFPAFDGNSKLAWNQWLARSGN